MPKGRDSQALISASGQRKILAAIRAGWFPGGGGVRKFIRKRKRPQFSPRGAVAQ